MPKQRQQKVLCPWCERGWDSRVMQGMEDHDGRGYSRRRKCFTCRKLFYTIEIVDEAWWIPRRPKHRKEKPA